MLLSESWPILVRVTFHAVSGVEIIKQLKKLFCGFRSSIRLATTKGGTRNLDVTPLSNVHTFCVASPSSLLPQDLSNRIKTTSAPDWPLTHPLPNIHHDIFNTIEKVILWRK
jgi:hypothetical protein